MKKYIIRTAIVLLFGTMIACEVYEVTNVPEFPWKTKDEFENAAVAAYGASINLGSWALFQNRFNKISMEDCGGQVLAGGQPNWQKGNFSPDFYPSSTAGAFWGKAYQAIAVADKGIDFVEEAGRKPFPDLSDEVNNESVLRVLGELYFMRGWNYLELMLSFAPPYEPGAPNDQVALPLRLHYSGSVFDAKQPEIGTVQKVYDQIISDLDKAMDLVPESYIQGIHHISYSVRATRYAVAVTKARAHFMRGEYAECEELCDYIIDGPFDLSEDPIEAWNKITDAKGKETIFQLPRFSYDTDNDAPYSMSIYTHSWGGSDYANSVVQWCEYFWSDEAMTKLGWVDGTSFNTVDGFRTITFKTAALADKRFQQLNFVRSSRQGDSVWANIQGVPTYVSAYNSSFVSGAGMDNSQYVTVWKYFRGAYPQPQMVNIPIMRVAEIYLTRSILRFKRGDKDGAAADLNMVRERAWDESVGGAFVPVTAATITEDMIHNERMLEMSIEGDRVEYFKGLKQNVPRGAWRVALGEPESEDYRSARFYWGIPADELKYNETLRAMGYVRPNAANDNY